MRMKDILVFILTFLCASVFLHQSNNYFGIYIYFNHVRDYSSIYISLYLTSWLLNNIGDLLFLQLIIFFLMIVIRRIIIIQNKNKSHMILNSSSLKEMFLKYFIKELEYIYINVCLCVCMCLYVSQFYFL